MTTSDLSRFGYRELRILRDSIDALLDYGTPMDFYDDEVTFMMNSYSGNVFLTNSEYQVAMLSGSKLESWYYSPYEGREGFWEDLVNDYDDMHPEDQEWFRDVAKQLNREDELVNVDEDE